MAKNQQLNWIIGPAGQCVSLIAEETKIATLLQHSLLSLSHSDTLLQMARLTLRNAKAFEAEANVETLQKNSWG